MVFMTLCGVMDQINNRQYGVEKSGKIVDTRKALSLYWQLE